MKTTLQVGLAATKHLTVDDGHSIGFIGKEGMVYATPRMVSSVEYACRDLLLEHLDDGEVAASSTSITGWRPLSSRCSPP
jgi:predicted thioesterase